MLDNKYQMRRIIYHLMEVSYQWLQGVHGTKYNKMLFAHTKKVLKKYDKNNDNQFSFEEFKVR